MKSVVVKYVSGVEEKFQSNKEKMGFRSLCVNKDELSISFISFIGGFC